MLKYIDNIIKALKDASSGMKKNAEKWTGQPVTAAEIDAEVAALESAGNEVSDAEKLLVQKREAARKLVAAKSVKVEQVHNLAMGIHVVDPEKLNEYGISARKGSSARPVPGKGLIVSIADDSDGIGFVITINVQPEADHYEIEKGEAPNVNELVLTPPFPFFKTTLKTVIVDDDVKKGVRYFYRVRAINSIGAGGWSESVNRVQ